MSQMRLRGGKGGAATGLVPAGGGTSGSNGAGKSSDQSRRQRECFQTAYLEPIEYEKEYPKQCMAVGKILTEAKFTKAKEITMVGKMRFKVELERKENYADFAKINFEPHNLKIFIPRSTTETICFVRGIPKEYSEKEIKLNTQASTEVLKVERIKRKGQEDELIDTNNVKVTVRGNQVPQSVKIYGCPFKAELYVFPVKMCTKCWRYGHGTKNCRGKAKCKRCGGEHKEEECEDELKCPNCKKNHPAGSKECPERQRREKIRKTMMEKGSSYKEAADQFPRTTTNRFELLSQEDFPEMSGGIRNDENEAGGSKSRGRRNASYSDILTAGRKKSNEQTEDEGNERERVNCMLNVKVVEEIVSQFRQDLLKQLQSRTWLKPLIDLKEEIERRMNGSETDIDADQLIIYTYDQIKNIIRNTAMETRTHNPRIEEKEQNGQ